MKAKKMVAMLLAGGQGSRLHVLTESMAKPAVPYGGKYRIIDFTLSNCSNSAIDTVGVLTQYRPLELNRYIGNGASWDLNRNDGGVYILPPYSTGEVGEWYLGTANAIYQNIGFIEQYSPKYVLILSGDHIYKMNYASMMAYHEENEADCTIAVIPVPIEEASRFGIMNTDEIGRIYEFEEKPKKPKSNKASMGVYIFTWEVLREYLRAEHENADTSHDFGKDIIPALLRDEKRLFAYNFTGYWKDVGTIESLWSANMDLLEDPPVFNLYDTSWRIYSKNPAMPPHYVAPGAMVARSIVTEGAKIYGSITTSIIFAGVTIEKDAVVVDSIIMPNAVIKKGARIFKTIVGEGSVVCENVQIGQLQYEGDINPHKADDNITVLGENVVIPDGKYIDAGAIISQDCFKNIDDQEA